jgi:hypothetical protein
VLGDDSNERAEAALGEDKSYIKSDDARASGCQKDVFVNTLFWNHKTCLERARWMIGGVPDDDNGAVEAGGAHDSDVRG